MGTVCAGWARGECAHARGQGHKAAPGNAKEVVGGVLQLTYQGYGFVKFLGEDDADYSVKIMNMLKLFGKPVMVNKASAHQKNLDVGVNIVSGKNLKHGLIVQIF